MAKPRRLTPQQRQRLVKKADDLCLDLGKMAAVYFGGGDASLVINMGEITDLVYEINHVWRRLRETE